MPHTPDEINATVDALLQQLYNAGMRPDDPRIARIERDRAAALVSARGYSKED